MDKKDEKNKIEDIYDEYIDKLRELQKEQSKVINDFINQVEQKKLEKIRREL
ncbi:hypothetical protein HON36_02880 [Candidatus Parcubacteria bacterium]|jgi:hypothetical protein|nr:hypothetical protein [Candidatus Parcubacteria bacterium]MBT7228567.1 hypothetical protein [Candidatus Parcubacteria bacterium]